MCEESGDDESGGMPTLDEGEVVFQFPDPPTATLPNQSHDNANLFGEREGIQNDNNTPIDLEQLDRSLAAAVNSLRVATLDPTGAFEDLTEAINSELKTFMSGTDLTETYMRNLVHGDFPVVSLESIKKWSQTGQFYKKFPQMLLLDKMRDMLSINEREIPKGGFPPEFPVDPLINDKVSLWSGDITTLQVDAIVNSAHPSMAGGGGVDGYIHARAGDKLTDECLTLSRSLPGEAKITKGYQLPASHVIHTVGPTDQNAFVLEACYVESLDLLVANKLRTIVFPCIATGHYDYPIIPATKVALRATRVWLEEHKHDVDRIIFCTFKVRDEAVYEAIMPSYFPV